MLRKRLIPAVLCLSVLFIPLFSITASALDDSSITAPSAILIEASTGKILYEKNSHEQRPCASITKVMTLLLVFEAIDRGELNFEETITASEHAASMGGSDIWLEPGETMSCNDMIKATVVASANDAAVALAEHICGSEDVFVEQMNKRAKELGMNDTVFKNCNGLDEEGHITSAYDVALMSQELIKHEKIFDYTSIWLDTLRDGKTQIVNTNKLLKTYNGITGLKTGTTDDAGCCMSATAVRNNVSLIAVVLGCATGKERFSDCASLLDYGFANITVKELTVPDDIPTEISVDGGMNQKVGLNCEVSENIILDKSNPAEITTKINLPESIEAPVEQGQKIGTLVYCAAEEVIVSCEITATESVEKATFFSVLAATINSLLLL